MAARYCSRNITPSSSLPRFRIRDHPRSRGVYLRHATQYVYPAGSSPLARGLQRRIPAATQANRIIPARAGFTAKAWKVKSEDPGSSPLARGLLPVMEGGAVRLGIIPARAGFTVTVRPDGVIVEDHPRSRGVYQRLQEQGYYGAGSSPLARGLPQ